MEPCDLFSALAALGEPEKKQTKISLVREQFDQIEAALRRGVTREQVLATLNAHGMDLTPGTFSAIVHRLRKEKMLPDRDGTGRGLTPSPGPDVVASAAAAARGSSGIAPAAPVPSTVRKQGRFDHDATAQIDEKDW